MNSFGISDEVLEMRMQCSSQAPANSAAPDCCKRPGSLSVTTADGERFEGICRSCGRKHRRAFPDLSKLLKEIPQ